MNGNELRALREGLGWTQQQLADYWELDRVTIGLYEGRGDSDLPRSKMFDILGKELGKKSVKPNFAQECKHIKKAIEFIESQADLFLSVSDQGESDPVILNLRLLAADLKRIVY